MGDKKSILLYELKKQIKAKGYTYKDVANHLGCTVANVSNALNGQHDITLEHLSKMLGLIGGNLDATLEGGARFRLTLKR